LIRAGLGLGLVVIFKSKINASEFLFIMMAEIDGFVLAG
jgi:hypothetical protein